MPFISVVHRLRPFTLSNLVLTILCLAGIAFSVVRSYISAAGPAMAFASVLFIVSMQASRNLFDFFLAHWTSSLASVPLQTRLLYMSYLASANLLIAIIRSFLFAFAGLFAAKTLHLRLLSHISSAGLSSHMMITCMRP